MQNIENRLGDIETRLVAIESQKSQIVNIDKEDGFAEVHKYIPVGSLESLQLLVQFCNEKNNEIKIVSNKYLLL